jgi:hypothetical protein
MSFVNEGLIPVTSQGIVLLAYITSAIVCTIATVLFYRRPVDVEGNPVPNGPLGVPIIGTFYSSFWVTTVYWRRIRMSYRILPVLVSLS